MSQTKLYKFFKNTADAVTGVAKKGDATSDGKGFYMTYIPICEDNKDYQEYLKWVEEGNTAEEAD